MKGIILAGGSGTRMHPITTAVNKHLMPVYDKPVIYYPLSVLMLGGIREILLITTPADINIFKRLLTDGSHIGISIAYAEQNSPRGLVDAFIIGEDFIDQPVCLILGDNIFFGDNFPNVLTEAKRTVIEEQKAVIFAYYVSEPRHYGVVEFDAFGNVLSLEEKPKEPKSPYAVPGLYFYPEDVVSLAKKVTPSARGELEITTLNELYLKQGRLKLIKLGRGYAWFDAGTHDSLLEASNFVEAVEKRQGLKIGSIEEVAYRMGYITLEDLEKNAKRHANSSYGKYLIRLVREQNEQDN